MVENDKTKLKQEICSIRIMFPVSSDEQAIDKKRKIADVLIDIPDVVINFSIVSGRPTMPVKLNGPN